MSRETKPDALQALQNEIYRDKVLRARAMSTTERLDEALELSNDIYTWMLDGAKSQCGLTTDDEGWLEVQRRLRTLRKLHERTLYKPVHLRNSARQSPPYFDGKNQASFHCRTV